MSERTTWQKVKDWFSKYVVGEGPKPPAPAEPPPVDLPTRPAQPAQSAPSVPGGPTGPIRIRTTCLCGGKTFVADPATTGPARLFKCGDCGRVWQTDLDRNGGMVLIHGSTKRGPNAPDKGTPPQTKT